MPDIKVYQPQTNERILNAIRKVSSDDYKKRVPRAVQADIQTTMARLADNKPTWNEFLSALVNQIGLIDYKNKLWSNPLAPLKGEFLPFGSTVEEVATGLVKAHVYDPDNLYMERILFGQHRPDAISSFHTINREVFYPVTINRTMLQRAFTSEYGLSNLITGLMNAPATSDQWDEFTTIANLLKLYDENDGFFKVKIGDVAAQGSTETTAKAVLRVLRAYAQTLTFISENYNAAGVPSFNNADELVLIGTPDFFAALDVEALAGLFNVQYAEIKYRTIPMLPQYMPKGVQAILTSSDFFVLHDTFFDTTSMDNPVGLTENFYLHHHGIYSLSRFVNAIAFSTTEETIIAADDAPVTGVSALTITDEDGNVITSLDRGRNHLVAATATTTGYNDAVRWSISGAEHTRTRISQTGILYVDDEETAQTITVQWAAVDMSDGEFSGSQSFTVTGGTFQQWPNPSYQPDADNDGLREVTPLNLTVDDNDNVTIPSVVGVQYRKAGTDVPNGSVHKLTASTTFTAVARPRYELAAGAPTSWTLAP